MLARVVQQPDDVMIVEGIESHAARAPDPDETGGPKQSELVRDRRLGQADERRQIADAAFAVGQGIDQAHARGITEEFEDFRDRLQGPPAQQTRFHVRQGGSVVQMRLSAREVLDAVGGVPSRAYGGHKY